MTCICENCVHSGGLVGKLIFSVYSSLLSFLAFEMIQFAVRDLDLGVRLEVNAHNPSVCEKWACQSCCRAVSRDLYDTSVV